MMKRILFLLFANGLLFAGFAQSKYDQHKAFDPEFYPIRRQ